jgi:hypothetical protein
MADERKCYAGDLGTDQIGCVIEVRVQVGDHGAFVRDVLTAVQHRAGVADGPPRTEVWFENLKNSSMLGSGFMVAHDDEALVLR